MILTLVLKFSSCSFNLFAMPIKEAENILERDHAVMAKNKCPVEDQMHMDSKARGGNLLLHRPKELSLPALAYPVRPQQNWPDQILWPIVRVHMRKPLGVQTFMKALAFCVLSEWAQECIACKCTVK